MRITFNTGDRVLIQPHRGSTGDAEMGTIVGHDIDGWRVHFDGDSDWSWWYVAATRLVKMTEETS